MRKLTTEEFINRAKDIHGDTYDYSQTEYKSSHEKIKIICKIHGVFYKLADKHYCGQGCPKCAFKSSSLLRSMTTEDFIKKAKEKHGYTYNYNKTKYITSFKKIIITCRIHGDFYQTPNRHLKGQRCPECAKKILYNKLRSNSYEFIEKSKKVHNDKYDYSLVEYKNSNSKVIIICSKHGEFIQLASGHISGYGCKKCASEKKRNYHSLNPKGWNITNWNKSALVSKKFDSFKVYIIRCWNDNEEFYKVGRTFVKINRRFSGKTNMPYKYEVIKEMIFDTAKEAFDKETELKRIYKKYKYVPKISFNGKQECFSKINLE